VAASQQMNCMTTAGVQIYTGEGLKIGVKSSCLLSLYNVREQKDLSIRMGFALNPCHAGALLKQDLAFPGEDSINKF